MNRKIAIAFLVGLHGSTSLLFRASTKTLLYPDKPENDELHRCCFQAIYHDLHYDVPQVTLRGENVCKAGIFGEYMPDSSRPNHWYCISYQQWQMSHLQYLNTATL